MVSNKAQRFDTGPLVVDKYYPDFSVYLAFKLLFSLSPMSTDHGIILTVG